MRLLKSVMRVAENSQRTCNVKYEGLKSVIRYDKWHSEAASPMFHLPGMVN